MPLRVVLDNVTRVTFPAFSRMQDDMENLKKAVTRSIFFITFLVFPAAVGIVILAPIIFQSIPKFSQWMPAVVPLTFLAINVLFAAVTTQLTNLLSAIGKDKNKFRFNGYVDHSYLAPRSLFGIEIWS